MTDADTLNTAENDMKNADVEQLLADDDSNGTAASSDALVDGDVIGAGLADDASADESDKTS